jgi:hypothetical protein
MLISFHYILHVFDSIIDCGPCWTFWQYPMERLCGMLLPLVRSKLHPYRNLTNNVILAEKFNHLFFLPLVSNRLLGKSSNALTKNYSNHRVFIINDKCEELYWPSKQYTLNSNEIKQLKHFYSLLLKSSRKNIEVSINISLYSV